MKKLILLSALCMVGGMVVAQDTAPTAAGDFLFDSRSHIRLGKGDVTWSGSASLVSPVGGEDAADSVVSAYGSLGYFLVDTFEIEVGANYLQSGDLRGSAVSAGLNMYFREFFDKWYPYAGLGVSKWMSDLSDQGTHVQVKLGARYYFTDSLGMRIWLEYDRGDNLIYNSDGTVTAYIGVFSMAY